MTNYHLNPTATSLSAQTWLEKKEKRRQQLAEVRERRRLIYELMRKMQNS
jgi:hypothetical protein